MNGHVLMDGVVFLQKEGRINNQMQYLFVILTISRWRKLLHAWPSGSRSRRCTRLRQRSSLATQATGCRWLLRVSSHLVAACFAAFVTGARVTWPCTAHGCSMKVLIKQFSRTDLKSFRAGCLLPAIGTELAGYRAGRVV